MKTPLRVLMIEDSEEDAALIALELRRAEYDLTFERVDTGPTLIEAVDKREWDLVICDYSMPCFNGLEALRYLRRRGLDTPFIFVCGTIGEETAVLALKEGAQDYVMKDNLGRVLPAIKRELHDAEQRREKERLERQVEHLKRFEAIGRLAGGIAHDFNNVTATILGWAQLGSEETADTQAKDRFSKIRAQAEHAARLTAQLLAFARRQVLKPQPINLNDTISEMSSLLKSTIGANIQFEQALSPDLHLIAVDPTQVTQVVMNLCLNARDAMPQGGCLRLETENVEIDDEFCKKYSYAKPGAYILLVVSDTGVGMDAETLDHLFEPFFTTKRCGRGTGLGLATVYGIVKQHGGIINVLSELGQGAKFCVYFPITSGVLVQTEQPPAVQMSSMGTETILLAEDHEGVRELTHKVLTSRGYRVILAANGEEALHVFSQDSEKIQLVILDVEMPVSSGPETYGKMSAIKPSLPVIFISGHTAEIAALDEWIAAGAVFLPKPFTINAFTEAISHTLHRHASELTRGAA